MQGRLLWLFGMNHQEEGMIEKAKRVLKYAPADSQAVGVGLAKDVLSVLPEYVDLERKEILGLPVDPEEEKRITRAHEQFYKREYLDPNWQPDRDRS